jgi:hypothetical protein
MLERRIAESPTTMSEYQLAVFADLVTDISAFPPDNRVSAAEIADHPWFTGVEEIGGVQEVL